MTTFHVPDMTCRSCAERIGRALAQADLPAGIEVDIDVAARQIRLSPGALAAASELVRDAITRAGYTPQAAATPVAAPRGGGCCCASRRAAPCCG